mmetsp:Transcript_22780/g.33638  ORF Transcript_22780/g.33638 Transcript_22780/m.33638 type:complete len:245 (+) Transcript_22780:142-876(+)
MDSKVLARFWENHYTSEEAWLPFAIPGILWLCCWLYCQSQKKEFSRWYRLHTFHHVVAIGFGIISLHYGDDAIFNERIGILWSMPYFMVDILDCLMMGHITYTMHGIVCFSLGLCNYNIPLLRALRMNSRATFIESSSIILYQVKQNRNPVLFLIFAIVYTACRIVWIPLMAMQLHKHTDADGNDQGLPLYHPILVALGAFYGLQIHWWMKIIRILLKGGDDEKSKKEAPDQSSPAADKMKKEG